MDLIYYDELDKYIYQITESNKLMDTLDNMYLESEEDKNKSDKIKNANGNIITKTFDLLISAISKLKEAVANFLNNFIKNNKTKEIKEKFDEAAKENPSIRNEKFSIFNIFKRNQEYNKALASIDASRTKGDSESIDKIMEVLSKNSGAIISTSITLASGLSMLLGTSDVMEKTQQALTDEEQRLKKIASEKGKDAKRAEKEAKHSRAKIKILESQIRDNVDYHKMSMKTIWSFIRGNATDQDKAIGANWAAKQIDKGGIKGKMVINVAANQAAKKSSVLGKDVSNMAKNIVKKNPEMVSAGLKTGAAALQAKDLKNKHNAVKDNLKNEG